MREWSTSGPTGIVPSPRSQAPDSRSSGTDYQQILTPTLRAGQVVAMGNLAVHKSAQARTRRGAGPRAVVPASLLTGLKPDRRRVFEGEGSPATDRARTREALVEAMSRAICAVTARDALGFIEHCGYRIASQPL
jgi:hypothetical protein